MNFQRYFPTWDNFERMQHHRQIRGELQDSSTNIYRYSDTELTYFNKQSTHFDFFSLNNNIKMSLLDVDKLVIFNII